MIIIIVFNPTSVYFPSLFLSFDSIQTSSLFIIHGHAEKKTDWQTRKEQCHIMCYRMVGIKVGVVSREPGKKSRRHLSPVFHFLLSRNKSTNIKHQDTQEDHEGKKPGVMNMNVVVADQSDPLLLILSVVYPVTS